MTGPKKAAATRRPMRDLTIVFSFLNVLSWGFYAWQVSTSPAAAPVPVFACLAAAALFSVFMFSLLRKRRPEMRSASVGLVVGVNFIATAALLVWVVSLTR